MQSTRRLSDETLQIAVREFTPRELCRFAAECEAAGRQGMADFYVDALRIHARKIGWGELIRLSMSGWKEEHDDAEVPAIGARVHS